ncbi:O-antigen ligase family protein [Mycolicibacterium sp.]|uniref:O-antigen ligase family protein n=1 Tax=Mycolicibacterium sp. TaxID=2320850 RepID=UPI003D12E4CF
MTAVRTAPPATAHRLPAVVPVAALVCGLVVAVAATLPLGSKAGQALCAGAFAVAVAGWALARPVVAVVALIVVMFLRLPLSSQIELPFELWWFVFALVLAATALWLDRTPDRLRGTGPVEWAMVLYLMWNVYSMVAPHKFPAIDPLEGAPLPVAQFIAIGTLLPFALYVVGRYTFDRPAAVRTLLWTVLTLAAYSAAVSIMPFAGLGRWVWPRYIVTDPEWNGRAVGIFNQPVVNGMVLTLGFATAVVLASRRGEPVWRRALVLLVALSCGAGIYLTHTRAVWLSAVVVLVLGAVLAKGFRRGFVAALGLVAAAVAVNWSAFTSSDRQAGGVASQSEIQSRLNGIQTALWARAREPFEGWGIGRFPAVNRHHHQQWSLEVPWIGGYGEASHTNEMGLLAELGLIGLTLWIAVLLLIAHRLREAYRRLPDHDLCGRPLAVIAIMAMAILVCTGLTVDLRYFDFPTITTFLIAGVAVGCSDRAQGRHHA